LNLVSNAVKFTPAGGSIEVSAARRADQIEIIVRDSGIGISEDFLPFVFDKFRQGDASPTRLHGGLGLGLSIVHQLVRLHDGEIAVHSDGEGRGTTFTVRLPLAEAESSVGSANGSPV
jgi:signal transduction histidine kinase